MSVWELNSTFFGMLDVAISSILYLSPFVSGDHGSEPNPWQDEHNRAPSPSFPLTIERRMSRGEQL